MTREARRGGSLLVAAALAGVLAAVLAACSFSVSFGDDPDRPVSSDLNDFAFESLSVAYALSRADDGTSRLTVEETFVALFPEYDQNRGMRRAIPDAYLDAPLNPRLVSITDENGAPRESETDSEDGVYTMTSRAGDYVHGRQTYVFTYTLENVTRSFADTASDEFYWKVNGLDWPQGFGEIRARLTVDPSLAGAMTGASACYVGYAESRQQCVIETDAAAGVSDASAAPVPPYQGVTIAVAFAPGTFTPFDPSYLASPWGWLQGAAGLGAVGALVLAVGARARRLRDEPGRPAIIAEYTPPPGIDALESAVLLGLVNKAIPAEVLEQAVVGSIRIVEGGRKPWGRAKLTAVLVDPAKADGDGRMLLEGLFPGGAPGDEFEFGRQDTRLSAAAQKILKAASTALDARGLRRTVPVSVRAWPVVLAVVSAIAVFGFGFAALGAGVAALVPVVLMILSGLVFLLVVGLVARKPKTAAGAEVRDHLAGLEVFIAWAEADRIRMLQSPSGAERVAVDVDDPRQMLDLYERLLPYAVVFGQEKEWAEQLAGLYGPGASPAWYAGTGGFSAASFSSGISTLSTSSSSSSTTSGGSGGGGSVGGGGGGGGGGGV